jgi:hypothetical protein
MSEEKEMAIANNRRATIRLTHQELVFIQKLLRSEYHFITEDERHARQAFGRKLSDITLPGSSDGSVDLFLTQLEISFLQKLTKSSYSFLTMAEREARQKLRLKIRSAWEEVQAVDSRARREA